MRVFGHPHRLGQRHDVSQEMFEAERPKNKIGDGKTGSRDIFEFRTKARRLDCDLPSDQNDAIARQPEEVADVYGVSLHRDIKSFLPLGYALQDCQDGQLYLPERIVDMEVNRFATTTINSA